MQYRPHAPIRSQHRITTLLRRETFGVPRRALPCTHQICHHIATSHGMRIKQIRSSRRVEAGHVTNSYDAERHGSHVAREDGGGEGHIVAAGTPWESDLHKLQAQSAANRKRHRDLLRRVKKDKRLDTHFHALHEEAFDHIDCLTCANCCKTTSPRIHPKDVDRLARFLRMRPSDLIDTYMEASERE